MFLIIPWLEVSKEFKQPPRDLIELLLHHQKVPTVINYVRLPLNSDPEDPEALHSSKYSHLYRSFLSELKQVSAASSY